MRTRRDLVSRSIECRVRLTPRKRSRRRFGESLDSFTVNRRERRPNLIPATDRKATVKAVQQRFPNHDANLSCALHRFDPFARRFDFDQRRGSRLLQSLRMSTTLALAARAVPRYTSYPTAPHFSSDVGAETYAA
jgi:hypothetical protein